MHDVDQCIDGVKKLVVEYEKLVPSNCSTWDMVLATVIACALVCMEKPLPVMDLCNIIPTASKQAELVKKRLKQVLQEKTKENSDAFSISIFFVNKC